MSALDTIQTRVAQLQAEVDLANDRCALPASREPSPPVNPGGQRALSSKPSSAALTLFAERACAPPAPLTGLLNRILVTFFMHSATGAYEKMKTLQTRVEEMERQAITKDDEAKSLALKLVKVGGPPCQRPRGRGGWGHGGCRRLPPLYTRPLHPFWGGRGFV